MGHALFEFVAAHGPLELSLIAVTSAAGVHVGRALVAPGLLPRAERIQRAARTSALILLGCLPWFLVLGVVEGFVSPSETVGVPIKAALGLLLEVTFFTMALGRPAADSRGPAGNGPPGSDAPSAAFPQPLGGGAS
jgi:hypothetical protein